MMISLRSLQTILVQTNLTKQFRNLFSEVFRNILLAFAHLLFFSVPRF